MRREVQPALAAEGHPRKWLFVVLIVERWPTSLQAMPQTEVTKLSQPLTPVDGHRFRKTDSLGQSASGRRR